VRDSLRLTAKVACLASELLAFELIVPVPTGGVKCPPYERQHPSTMPVQVDVTGDTLCRKSRFFRPGPGS
jgi:hypothetical protein